MDVYEALYTTRVMRRMKPDPISLESQCRILDAAIRAPNGGNAQSWRFVVVDDPGLKAKLADVYARCREREYAELVEGRLGVLKDQDRAEWWETMRAQIKRSGDYFGEHFAETPLLVFLYTAEPHFGANVFPAVWSAMLAARAEGIGGVLSTLLRFEESTVAELLAVPEDEGWQLGAMMAFGYPLGRWGIAAKRRPVHEVARRNGWTGEFGVEVPEPLWGKDFS
ncbi:nitroreductase family protein [Amycolatopsis rhabdoformis]|uniref:Nitroreductase family protein n=1 Tax=Amycolatopsis rhabdoformis TaxID=1448059 RepID=A0ABZ1HYX8_9PSEU|nr:nitroreductase family protein [Amycolatopsis rhabdoformis]WSE27155.1 nitroreductase family protein [Amycolatopsis rhabdoformis]